MRGRIFIFLFLSQSCISFSQEKINLTAYFRFDRYDLDAPYKSVIDSAIQSHAITEVFIKAHCDSFGNHNYNDILSLKRANEVKQYLMSKKIKEDIVDVKAFGKRLPVNQNENTKARALNRRAEIVFISADSLRADKTDTLPKNIIARNDSIADTDTLVNDTSTLAIKNLEVGKTFVLQNLNFYGGRHVLLPKSHKPLKLLLNTLKANPTLEIEIQGHICCMPKGNDGMDIDTHTPDLSVNRARAIYDYLVQSGIDSSRLSYRGFGSNHKLVLEFTEADRTTNRRVEIKVLKK